MSSGGIIVDLFAGGGGASLGMEWGLGRRVDVAVNHDPEAVAMHLANHPGTLHYCQDVWSVSPSWATQGRGVDMLWASPDCTHHSKAKGGPPTRDSKRRDLAWVIVKWAAEVRPAVILMENVEEFKSWGPLDCRGQVIREQRGSTFRAFRRRLHRLGYRTECRELRACDFGAPTIRKRLFVVARRDGLPVTWPAPTHGPEGSGLLPYRTAAECIDWSIPCPSIFERKRPLAENTMRRIAAGIRKFVLEAVEPFIVSYYNQRGFRGQGMDAPLRTVSTENRFGLVTPYLVPRHGERLGQDPRVHDADDPLPTVTCSNNPHLVAAFLAKHYGGVVGSDLRRPSGTVTSKDHHGLVASHLVKLKGTCRHGQDLRQPLATVAAGGLHHAHVSAFLIKYYGEGGQWSPCGEPMHTLTAKSRMGLVTVTLGGEQYVLADIGMRMLQPLELFRAQGFPDDYVIDPVVNGKPLTKTAQVRMCGNSVPPQFSAALSRANAPGSMARPWEQTPLMEASA